MKFYSVDFIRKCVFLLKGVFSVKKRSNNSY